MVVETKMMPAKRPRRARVSSGDRSRVVVRVEGVEEGWRKKGKGRERMLW